MDSPDFNNEPSLKEGRNYCFDGFEVDPSNRTFVKDGRAIHLPGKAFDVLVELLRNAGRLVSKDELVDKVWDSRFVEEGSVARTVSKLRKALGDEGRDHRYIATVQGHGYRFIGDVRCVSSEIPPATQRPSPSEPMGTRPVVLWTLIAVVVVMSAGLALYKLSSGFVRAGAAYSVDRARLAKITQTGDVYAPRTSADGEYLAYISGGMNSQEVRVRHIPSGSTVTPVSNTPAIWAIDIATDNTFLYYIQKETNSEIGGVYRIPLLGGIPFKVASLASGGLDVSPDGSRIAFTRIDRENKRTSIILHDAAGGNERMVHSISFEDNYHAVAWAPDGNSLAASIKIAQPGGGFKWHMAEISLSDGSELRLGNEADMLVTGLEWLPDKSGLIANAVHSQTEHGQIYHVSYPDGLFRRITNDLDHYLGVSMTSDGKKVITMKERVGREVWSDIDGNKSLLTSGDDLHIDSVDWIGDDTIAFSEDVNGARNNYNIWKMRADGGQKQQLTFGGGYDVELTVSPDAEFIAFISRRSGRDQLWRVGVDGSDVRQLTNVEYNVASPMFSADSKHVLFLGWVDGALRLFQVPVDGGEPTLVLNDEIYQDWAPAPDNRRVAYVTFDHGTKQRRLHVVSMDGRIESVFDTIPDTCLKWSADNRSLYYTTNSDSTTNVWSKPLDGGQAKSITDFADQRIFRFAVSPNAGHLAIVRESVSYDAIMLTAGPH